MIVLRGRARCGNMKGTLQKKQPESPLGKLYKTLEGRSLACYVCRFFREDDPDIFYCELHRPEFPALCDQMAQSDRIAPLRNDWEVPDEL